MPSIDVVLVASLPDGDESLALAYVATALRQSGHRAHLITFRGFHQLEEAAARICALPAPLLGLSIPSGHAAIDLVALLHRVRAVGFKGHVTCGGAYATLARHRLLRAHLELDSVVRHDGEVPIVGLADALASGRPCDGVPGLTTRHGDGAAAPVDDTTGLSLIPDRAPTRLYAGVPSAKLSAVRGCWGGCRYCGLAGLRREALREATLRGLSCEAARRAGIGGMRRRPVEHVADEMQRLYRERGVRYFHLVDENHLPRDPQQACAVIEQLEQALEQRGVKERALSLMLRADVATANVVDALARLGLVRCLLGVESNTREGLAALGRGATLDANDKAIFHLNRHGISFHLNVLLIHPDSTIASIEQEVAALRGLEGGLIDPFQVEVLEGTELFQRLESSGRLRGGPHLWHFWPQEPAARRFTEVFFSLKRRVMGSQQLTAYAYEVLGMLAVAGKLGHLGVARHGLEHDARDLIAAHNQLWNELLEGAVQLAHHPDPVRQETFFHQGCVRAAQVTLQFARLSRAIRRAADRPLRTDACYPRTRTAVAFAASVLAAACGGVSSSDPRLASDAAAFDGPYEAAVEASASDASLDSPSDALSDAGSDAGESAPADATLDGPTCNPSLAQAELDALLGSASCPDVCSPNSETFNYRFILNATGQVIDMERDDGEPVAESLKQCYLAAVHGQVFPCLAQLPVWVPCNIMLK